jgi:TPP-dependent 2-oxoacid decarboxylase
MTGREGTWNVARYLIHRLDQLGIACLFGVPGNHLGPFLEVLAAERDAGRTRLAWVGTPTEMGAGYAADGYARIHGIGAAAVTYSVGAFSLLNSIGGAYAEEVPLVTINATPTFEQWLNFREVGLITSHMSPRFESNLEVYRQVTVDAQVISNSRLAPRQIDGALAACLAERRPVYLEVMEDTWKGPCAGPEGAIAPLPRTSSPKLLAAAVEAAAEKIGASRKPIFWAGEETDRQRLADELQALIEATALPFCTTIGAKSVLSENHPQFHGVYNGKASLPEVRRMFKEVADLRIGLGAWSTSKNLGGDVALGEDWIMAAHEGVSVGAKFFPKVQLGDFLRALRERLAAGQAHRAAGSDYYLLGASGGLALPRSRQAFLASLASLRDAGPERPTPRLTYDSFFARIDAFLEAATRGSGVEATNPYFVVSDAAFALLGSQNLRMVERRSYFAQNSWLAIGYSVGAVTGLKSARQTRRALVFVGDGSFQEICQELSTHTRLRHDSVIFVLNNQDFYGIEQMLVHPCYYAGQEGAAYYNLLHPWSYARLAEVFGSAETPMTGIVVADEDGLEQALRLIGDPAEPANRGPLLVHVRLHRQDYPAAIGYAVRDNCPPSTER